ncbi:MAG: EamA family transporter [Thiomonas sp. 20-64-5]|nr:MAG: EamA family transporter [Thiomonas sp. 20-64-5]
MSATTHARAVFAMMGATLLWSMAGVVTRHLHPQDGLDLVFWRSGFAALGVLSWLLWRQGPRVLARDVQQASALLWLSAAFWGVMFTAFMVALTLTTVAQTLIADSLSPLIAAVLGWLVLRHALPGRTWVAIALALFGMGWIAWQNLHHVNGSTQLLGTLIALAVPFSAAANWVSLRRAGAQVPMQAAVMIGAVFSVLAVALPAWPVHVDLHDLLWLAFLGVFQLALPGLLAVWAAQRLAPAEIGLLGLLEIVFGIFWAWIGAGEQPGSGTLIGGALVLSALAGNELFGWRGARKGVRGDA